jgi:Skp family chaperone for outer membrane proteins
MKTTLLLAVASLLPGLFLMQAGGSSSVAVIDFERAVSEAPGGKDTLNKLNTFRNEQATAIEKKQKEADDLANRLRTQGPALSEPTRAQLTKDLQTAQTSVQTMADGAQKQFAQMQQELLVPIEQKTAMAVSAYANEHSIKIVLDASALQNGLVYVHDTADITTEIIRRIASDLQKHRDLNASIVSDNVLNRNWLKFDLQIHKKAPLSERHRTEE